LAAISDDCSEVLLQRTRMSEVSLKPGIGGQREIDVNDPSTTLAAPSGSALEAGFSPYQRTCLSRYDAIS